MLPATAVTRLQSAVSAGVLSAELLPGSASSAQEPPLAMLSRSQALDIIRLFKLALEDPATAAKQREAALRRELHDAGRALAALRECSESLHRDEARVQHWVSMGEKSAAFSDAAVSHGSGEGDFSPGRLLQAWTALRRKGVLSQQECAQLGLLTYTRRLQARCDALQSECALQSTSASSARAEASRLRADLHDAQAAVQRTQTAAASREQQLRQGQENMLQLQSALHELQREHNANTAQSAHVRSRCVSGHIVCHRCQRVVTLLTAAAGCCGAARYSARCTARHHSTAGAARHPGPARGAAAAGSPQTAERPCA